MQPKRIFFALFVMLPLMAPQSEAQVAAGRPGAFLRLGIGARALALGGAYAAIAEDPSGSYWNPAGIGQINELQFLGSYQRMSLDRVYNFAAAAAPVGMRGSVALSWVSLSVSGIEARSGNSAAPDYLFGNSQNAVFLTYAHRLFHRFYFGVNLKAVFQQLNEESAVGGGFDVAALWRVSDFLRVGFTVQDVNTALNWESGKRERFPRTLRAGMAVNLESNFLIAVDAIKLPEESMRFALGAEYLALRRIPVRVGYTHAGMVVGGGVAVPLSNMNLRVDYSFGNDVLDGGATHKISVALAFARRPHHGPRRRRPVPLASENWRNVQAKRKPQPVPAKPAAAQLVKAPPRRPQIRITARVLNVRKGPGVSFPRIARVRQGQRFVALARIEKWIKIQLSGGQTGWVHSRFVAVAK